MVGSKKPTIEENKEKPRKISKKTVIICTVALILVCAVTIPLLIFLLGANKFDYLKSDLSEHITLAETDYKNYPLEVKLDEVTESDVERQIMNLLYQNRTASDTPAEEKTVPVSIGDKAMIYYRGYTVDERGIETEVDGASNMTGSYHELEIGSLSFIKGFEEGLIGAIPIDHLYNPQTDLIKSGEVSMGDVIYLSYTAMYPDGTTSVKKSERIDLSKDNIDALYGEGFKEYFESSNIIIGNKISEDKIFSHGGGTAVYCDMTVDYVIRCENEPVVIETRFPANYRDKALRGVSVNFDVYFKCTVVNEVPEYNEQFITETLEISAEALEEYEGESLVDKHRSYLYAELVSKNAKECETLIEEAIWDHYKEKAVIKSFPESAVESVYNDVYAERYSEYETYYSQMFTSLEEYIIAYYGATENADAGALMIADAQDIVSEKIIFYYIIRKENLLPSDEEYEKTYQKIYTEHLNYFLDDIYGDVIDGLKTEEEKQQKVKEIETQMLEYYGEEYFVELVYYDYAYDKVISFAIINE